MISAVAVRIDSIVSGLCMMSVVSAMRSDHALNCARSSGGIPSSSAITITGSGCAIPVTRSHSPVSGASPSSEAVISSIRGRSASTDRGVNARFTMPRRKVCSGGSEANTLRVSPSGELSRCSAIAAAIWPPALRESLENVS